MSCDPSKTCPICDQRGLPILPLRYAVARCDGSVKERAPGLQMPFGDGVQDIALPADSAHYTLRLLRPGYLYVFNELRGEWKAYVVNDQAYLMEFDIHSSTPPDVGDAEPCERMQNSAAGRCVMIPDADRARAVWLGFSDTAWTSAVMAKHRTQAWREKHMQRIDVGAWARGGTAPATQAHLQRLDKLGELVCEFALAAPENIPLTPEDVAAHEAGEAHKPAHERSILLPAVTIRSYPALAYSLHDYYNDEGLTESFLQAATEAAGDLVPAMVALADPVGITMELARLPAVRLEAFIANAEARPLAVSTAIENLRDAIMEDAENRKIYRTEREARELLDPGYMGMGDGGGAARGGQAIADWLFPEQAKQREELFERWRDPSLDELRRARREAWSKYEEKYHETQRAQWAEQWQTRLRAFDQTIIAPLAQAHVAWMTGGGLCNKLECCHDDADAHSGAGFVESLVLCIQDTQQYSPCHRVYRKWLEATIIERDNLVLRALAYNQQRVVNQLNEVSQGGLQPEALRGLPWDGLIKGYEEALAVVPAGRNAAVRLVLAIGGPMSGVMSRAVDHVIGPGLVVTGLIAKAPVEMVDVTMSKAAAIRELTARMTAINPQVGQLSGLNRAIDIQMRKARIRGVPVNGTGRFRYLIMADPQVVEDFPGVGRNGQPLPSARRFAEQVILTEADRAQLTRLRWRGLMPTSAGLGTVTALLQIAALGKVADDLDSSMVHERTENQRRYGTGVAALAGTLAETAGKWTESAAKVGSRLAIRIEQTLGAFLRVGGKALGIGAGVVMAVWDGMRGWKEVQEGNTLVGGLYLASGVLGVGALIAFGLAATGVGIVLVVLVIVIAVLIEVFKDNKIQDWLERSYFGTFAPGDRYGDLEVEMEQLQNAIKG